MPVEVGGAGLDNLTMALVEKELGRVSYALHHLVARPSNILLACVGPQRDRYLYPTVAGERIGWWIPAYVVGQNPAAGSWEGLQDPATAQLYATAESGD